MQNKILKMMSFELSGKFAQFRKFYSNSSSLSYFVPPRTVLTGLLASILEIPRNEYYDIFSPEISALSVCIRNPLKKSIHSMNYLWDVGNINNGHRQCKLEVVSTKNGGQVSYRVYLGVRKDSFLPVFNELANHISTQNFGFGLYLGQRQFKADIGKFRICENITHSPETTVLHSICPKEDFLSCETTDGIILCEDNIPIDMKLEDSNLRRTTTSIRIIHEQNGKELHGKFKNCYDIDGQTVHFFV